MSDEHTCKTLAQYAIAIGDNDNDNYNDDYSKKKENDNDSFIGGAKDIMFHGQNNAGDIKTPYIHGTRVVEKKTTS